MPKNPEPEAVETKIEMLNKKMDKIEKAMFGTKKDEPTIVEDIVSKIYSKLDYDKLHAMLTTLIVIGYILITLVGVGILLQCLFQSQLADVTEFLPIQ